MMSSPRQPLENLDAALQRAIAGGVADAEVRVARAERAAGDDEQVVADRLADELGAAAPGRLREEIKRAARPRQFVAAGERRHHAVALALVVGDDRADIVIQRDRAGDLHHTWSTHVGELLQLGHLVDEAARAVAEAEPPAGHAVRLAEAVEDDRILVVLGWAAEGAVVAKGAVDLVAQEQDVALL